MKINSQLNSILFTLESGDSPVSLNSELYKSNYLNSNIIIDLSNVVFNGFLNLLKTFSKKHNHKSFVIVSENIDYDKDDLNIIPTIQEAFDYIEMEEIERDLNSL
tara:strand:+ start:425 stop:739 length:315 start_codon:yes stop_codon:yes gene_type:complete